MTTTDTQDHHPYPYTVTVSTGGRLWRCGCGASGDASTERQARDEGADHQAAHQRAYEALKRRQADVALNQLEAEVERACQVIYQECEGYWPSSAERHRIAVVMVGLARG